MAMKKIPVKKPKIIPEAGETEYVVINPGQVEKIEEAIRSASRRTNRSAGSRTSINLQLGDDFWLKFWTGCFAASGCMSPDMALGCAKDLASKFKETK